MQMRLPTLCSFTLAAAIYLPAAAAGAEPTRSFPLPEPSAAASTSRYAPAADPTAQAPAPSTLSGAAPHRSPYPYPQGYDVSGVQPAQQPGYAWQSQPQSPVADQPSPGPRKESAERGPSSVSLSLSLLHLIGPLAEGTLEIRPFDHVGIAGVLGRGNFKVDGDDYSVWEYGGQLNIYSSAFDGLAVTGEVFRFSGEGEPEPGVKGTGQGTLLSGLIGYKGITSGGFTVIIQGGFTRVLAEVTAEHAQLGSESEDASTWLPMANLNLGLTL